MWLKTSAKRMDGEGGRPQNGRREQENGHLVPHDCIHPRPSLDHYLSP